jgi:hypothetical protein
VIKAVVYVPAARCASEPRMSLLSSLYLQQCTNLLFAAATGLEGFGILENVAAKAAPTQTTQADKELYLRRAKTFSQAWDNKRKRALVIHTSFPSRFVC